MKFNLISVGMLFLVSSAAMAAESKTVGSSCRAIELTVRNKLVNIYLSNDGTLLDRNFNVSVVDKNAKKFKIKGLEVSLEKASEIDTVEGRSGGWGGGAPFRSQVVVYGTKFHLKADERIGVKFNGCLPQEIKEMDVYLICNESTTFPDIR